MWILLNDTTELVAFRNGARFFDGTIEVQQGRYIIDAIFVDDSIRNLETSSAKYKILYGEYMDWNNTNIEFI